MIRQFGIKLSITFDRNMIWKSFWYQNDPWILNNTLNLKCQFWYLPQRASLARLGSQMSPFVTKTFSFLLFLINLMIFCSRNWSKFYRRLVVDGYIMCKKSCIINWWVAATLCLLWLVKFSGFGPHYENQYMNQVCDSHCIWGPERYSNYPLLYNKFNGKSFFFFFF